jgi:hypothetical protein
MNKKSKSQLARGPAFSRVSAIPGSVLSLVEPRDAGRLKLVEAKAPGEVSFPVKTEDSAAEIGDVNNAR